MQGKQLQILTVSQLTEAIKANLEKTFPLIHLQGEISNCKQQTSGHFYFSLKDAEAQISAVMFKNDFLLLKTAPKGGEQIIVKASLNVYPPKGHYQLVVRELSYVGIGELLQQLEELKIKLHRLGWFKKERKKPLPFLPKTIGIVTSPTGAVIRDILNIIGRRFPNFHVILNPVKVQGEGAAKEIAQGIKDFNLFNNVDVIIVCRGGGSLEDLWSFNDEKLAEAIYESQIPIISAVGHETDHCIADYVADLRAPTPSAAAEIVLPKKEELLNRLSAIKKGMQQTIGLLIQSNHYRLERVLKHPFMTSPYSFIEQQAQKVDQLDEELTQRLLYLLERKKEALNLKKQRLLLYQPTTQLNQFKTKLSVIESTLTNLITNKIKEKGQSLHYLQNLLSAINPRGVLKKGYSILFSENKRSVINSVKMIKEGEEATLLLSDGQLSVTINKIAACD